MIASMETYLRRGWRTCQKLLLNPKIRTGGVVLLCGGSGFLLSAASLGNYPQPLAMGLILAMSGWHAAVMSLGAMLGYWVFWGIAGLQGLVWSASGGLLALLLARHIPEEQPLIFPAISAFLTALTGLLFQLVLRDTVPVPVYFLRIVLAAGAGLLFPVALRRRTAVTDWLVGGVAVLALAQASPTPYLGLGYLAAGALAVGSAFPAAVLGGLGLDLAQVTNIPMTAVLCLAGVIRMIPFERKWMRCLAPGAACMVVMAICGIRDYTPLPGLILGGGVGILMPPSQETARRRGETGLAQVRLELGAEVLGVTQQLFLETAPPPVDASAVLQKVRQRACGSCSARNSCPQQSSLDVSLLQNPLEAQCRKSGRLIPELRRGQEQLKLLKADSARQSEYRAAMVQQYQFLGDFLRGLADDLPRRGQRPRAWFRAEAAARSQQGACQRRPVSCLSGARVPVLRPSLRRNGYRAGRRSGGAVGRVASAADAHRRVSGRPRPAHPQQHSRPPGQCRGGHGGLGGTLSRHRPRHVIQVGRRPQLAASPGQCGKNRDSHPTAGHFRNGKPGNGGEAVPASGGSAGIAQRRRGWRGDFPPV